ncbi:hypothetical protein DAEQUDRAFT_767874 [Daedalea quercina L-15889]|uniref:BTB domain-containing protein n=1 Tax=Daedalea quercina L-15889 TaxID=1314783 RepID=A0A165N8L3_9APHY|nr:hypothetical protein DAEQUDRAFT_767874 [Daedalea quercina L-15889]
MPNARKRARFETDDEVVEAPITPKLDLKHDAEVWFEDGNVVIVAGDVAFKVHRGVLSLHSEVFRDMFTIPPPPDDETLDGCHVVRVSDLASHIRRLLLVLYKGRTFLMSDEQTPFSTVKTLLRLAHKYQIPDLKDDALERIKAIYTDDFSAFEEPTSSLHPWLTHEWEDAFRVVAPCCAIPLLPASAISRSRCHGLPFIEEE